MNIRWTFFLVLLLCVMPTNVRAVTLYIDPASTTLSRGDAAILAVRLMPDTTAEECVNAVDVVLNYSSNINPVDVSVGSSILSLWVESPTINKDTSTITFAAGIPNGYCGRVDGDPRLTNILAEIVVRSPGTVVGSTGNETEATIDFAPETVVYLNDGVGTEAPLTTLGAKITLDRNPGASLVNPWNEAINADTIPPEPFGITLTRDTSAFGGRYFIVFDTTDKQTGISDFEVIEEPIEQLGAFVFGGVDAKWLKARSPYLLQDQTLNSVIRVRAIDKAGNEYIASLVPEETQRTLSRQDKFAFIAAASLAFLGLVILGIIIWYALRQRAKRRARAADDNSNSEIQ